MNGPLAIIDGGRFARAASVLSGPVPQDKLPRLPELECRPAGVHFRLQGGQTENGELCLRLGVDGDFELACQRCLKPLAWTFSTTAELLLASSLEEIEAADDDKDRVLASDSMDIGELIEDEIILAIPMVPRHDHCGLAGVPADGAGKFSPFSVLSTLKRGR